MIKNYIFLGPPGIGKGTVAKLLSEEFNLAHISTGEIFRKEIEKQTELGRQVQDIVSKGEYVPDDITNQIIKNTLSQKEVKERGFILDGYPRTTNQAEFLEENGFIINKVVLLFADENKIIDRLLNRKRSDDNPEIIKDRLRIYDEKTKHLIDYYLEKNLLVKVDANGTIEENFKNLLESLND